MIFEELKCKNDKQTTHDAAQLVRYGAKQTDDITQLIEYSSSQSKDVFHRGTSQFICANEIASVPLGAERQDAREVDWSRAIAELQSAYLANTNTKQPFRHFVVSLAEGEQLSLNQWRNTIKQLMPHLGYENARYIAFKHSDTDNEHIHIVASTTDLLTGKIISNWQSHLKAQEIMREQEVALGLQTVQSSGVHHSSYDTDILGEKEKTVIRVMRRKVDSAIRTLPPSSSLTQLETALLKQGIEIELIPDRTNTRFKGIAYRFHQYRFAGSSLRSGNKYTLGKLIKNSVLAPTALTISDYDKHHVERQQAQAHFNATRKLAIAHADEVKKQIEEYNHQRYQHLLLIAKKHTEAQEQFELWCDYAKKIHAVRDKAVVRAIYECERGIYQASNTMSKWFYHILLIMFEYSQIAKDLVTISPLQEIQAEKIQLDKRQTDLLEPVNHFRNP
ncbi:relaxase/mobilization nuclease domain-containing protein [Vibrio alginolyticus]|uniref:relaxase/mobilization nuclease domain-containing protein n=1 Tax=Vibrio alginolyticus TaxID=663 RepID=UPI000306A58E|nr:relaxase/mobilization nuclease domain-containing protein [Vibrio alginolyticus]EGQ7844878.1 relaxase/mobilization nuclease domain-containing protein [Vibrio alginolyticus]EGR0307187.1 relaxase [Vibrio alginolyticus]EHK5087044.1 relaxase/mobilization nuclease domain-containing protein [Vibrio alginolyticus]EKA2634361.1 relaxase/mobilization nuclease domain-containing protein [Vibrio alginolyticus]ELB2737376.1 relaxase/mobilization nuclease domain-containing protein [Vibrio alginolyticus]